MCICLSPEARPGYSFAWFLDSWRVKLSISAFISRLCVGAMNSTSLFIPGMSSSTFQCKCRLFWMLRALAPVSMWARIVHSTPPLLFTSCQLYSNLGRSLSVSLYLRTFSSNSISSCCIRFAQVESWGHSTSTEPIILMLIGRLGRVWLLECTNISFREFFSLAKTGHILALRGSRSCGIEMPREVKKEGGTSECSWPFFPPGVAF